MSRLKLTTGLVGLALLFMVLAAPAAVHAQSYHIRTFHEQDGLSSNSVLGVVQDADGRLLFSTRQGVSVFNGFEWSLMENADGRHPQGSGLITQDALGGIWWMGHAYPFRLLHLQDGVWVQVEKDLSPEFNLDKVVMDSWVDAEGRVTIIFTDISGRVALRRDGEWRFLRPDVQATREGIVLHSVGVLGSRLLVCTPEGLLEADLEDPVSLEPSSLDLPSGPVYAATRESAEGVSWLVGSGWFARLEDGQVVAVHPTPEQDTARMAAPTVARMGPAGGVYFVDFGRVYYFHPDRGLENLDTRSGLASNGANGILVDREGSVWITSIRGLSQIVSRRLSCWNKDWGLQGEEVSAIHHRRDGSVILGHRTGLTILDPEPRTINFGATSSLTSRVIDIEEDAEGRIWLAADYQGLGLLGDDDTITWWQPDTTRALSTYGLLARPDGSLLLATNNGLASHKDGRFRFLNLRIGLDLKPMTVARRMEPLSGDRILLTTAWKGCHLLEAETIQSFPGHSGDGTSSVYVAQELPDGTIMVGATGGLFELGEDGLEVPDNPALRIGRPVYALALDLEGRLWVGTDQGVRIWDGQRLESLTSENGLLGSEANRDALKCDAQGRMWIGTNSGLSIHDRNFETQRDAPLQLQLVSITAGDEKQPLAEKLVFSERPGTLVLQFRAPTFVDPAHMEFRIRAQQEGSSAPLPTVRWPGVVVLNNLPPGQTRFEVQARTSDGRVSNPVATPRIVIVPPLWERWYARVAMVVVGVVFIWLVFAYLSGKRYSRQLEREVAARTRDLTASEEVARRESHRLSGILESISDGVLAVDGQGRIVLFNQAAEAILKACSALELGASLDRLLPPDFLEDADQRRRYEEILARPANVRLESEKIPVRLGPRARWFEVSAVPLSGSAPGTVFAFRDVTHRLHEEENERRAQKLESLGLLAGGIAHDFNNLLTIMVGSLSMMEPGDESPAGGSPPLELIHTATERARKLTRQLLTFAKGGLPRLEKVELGDLVSDTVSFNLSGSNVNCRIERPPQPIWAEVDPDQFGQALGNLVINACQAMPDGGRLVVRMTPRADTDTVVIEIRDFGPGIAPADQERIFDPYFSTKAHGSGLGLAIVHSVVEKHGGRIQLESSPGEGAAFFIEVPLCAPPETMDSEAMPASPDLEQEALNILVMDDEAPIRTILSGILEKLGHRCTQAADGRQVLEIMASSEGPGIDLVLLDLTIPGGMGGLETLRQLRAMGKEVPVLVASGYSDDPVMADHMAYGFAGCLAKPFALENVRQALVAARPGVLSYRQLR